MESNKYLFTVAELDQLLDDVRKAEREACAQICDEWANGLSSEPEMEKIAAEIRARGRQ